MDFFQALFYVALSFGVICFSVMAVLSAVESYQRIKYENDRYRRELKNK